LSENSKTLKEFEILSTTVINFLTRWGTPELEAAWRLENMDRLLFYRQNPSPRNWESYQCLLTWVTLVTVLLLMRHWKKRIS